VNTICGLCMDATERASSGHPETPLGMAPAACTLWQRYLRFAPADPIWPNRDRFVLSEGHASRAVVVAAAPDGRAGWWNQP
jgi:transketolase